MDVNAVLLDILIVLVAAKAAAEVADRVGVPAVVGEIVAGLLVGPSVLGVVEPNEVLHTLAELGVILLLLDVGLEMDLRDLRSVGRSALAVGVIGVAAPMMAGASAALALGRSGDEALFLGAALTATSVGITARVFADLRALGTVEARTVLGAAVADDVLGLIVLTVVTRIVTQGSVDTFGIVEVVAVALAFVVVATAVGLRAAPPLFAAIRRHSRSSGTLVALALAFTLAFAELAHAADLAPIIGAFVAGLALGRTNAAHHVRRDLAPVGHLLVPVFFLQIGIDADVGAFADPKVIAIAGVLLAVGIAGKLVAAVGMAGRPGDKLLVGIGMVPRGEVGLIFATIGLREGVFDREAYGALLLVVLVTTVLTPPALRARLLRTRPKPAGSDHTLARAVAAARACAHSPPDDPLREWFAAFPLGAQRWDDDARTELFALLRQGTSRSWRLLVSTGVLHRALPELDDALARARGDGLDLDPLGALQFPRLDAVRETALTDGHSRTEQAVLLAAAVLDACDGGADPLHVGRRTVARLGLDADLCSLVVRMIDDAPFLPAAALRVDASEQLAVVRAAAHLRTSEYAHAVYLLGRPGGTDDAWRLARVDELHDLVQKVLADGTVPDEEHRRSRAAALADSAAVRRRIEAMPPAFLLLHEPETLLSCARRCVPAPARHDVVVTVEPPAQVSVVGRGATELLARTARALDEFRCPVLAADVVTWPDGVTLCVFAVGASLPRDQFAERVRALLRMPLDAPAIAGATASFDDHGSPWHTRCTVDGPDAPGVLRAVTAAFAGAGVQVHGARIAGCGATFSHSFDVTTPDGAKLDDRAKRRVVELLERGVSARRGRVIWR